MNSGATCGRRAWPDDQAGGVAMIDRAVVLGTILMAGLGFTIPAYAEAWTVKGACSKGNIAQSDGVQTGVANGMSGKDYLALMQRARAASCGRHN